MTTNDELRQMREAYANDDVGVVDYISFLEAHAAAQQQRIDELTAALKPFAQRFERDNMDIAGDDSDPMYRFVMNTGELLPGTPVIERKEFRRAHEALRGKGAE